MRADGFKDVLNRNGVVLEAAGGNRAAVENESGDIQSRQGHDATRNGLVAANEDDERIEEVAPGDQLDRVRDDFAADERSAHAFRTHGDAVGDGDGVELERSATRGANAFLHMQRQFAEVIIAGADFNPGVRHADERLFEIVVAQTRDAQHGASGRAIRSLGERTAAWLGQRVTHCSVPSMVGNGNHPEIYRPEKLRTITWSG